MQVLSPKYIFYELEDKSTLYSVEIYNEAQLL